MGEERGYFVRVGSPDHPNPGAVPGREFLGNDHGPRPRRRRRRQIARPIGTVLAVAAIGFFVWAQIAPESAANHDLRSAIADARGAVMKASTDPSLKRAEIFYNQQYSDTGAYPYLSDNDQHNGSNTDFGVGVTTLWCNAHAIVLQSMTGSGSLSRLLVDGKTVGDVFGEQQCPADLSNPTPWSVKPAS
jgi:hypothetical protein